MTERLLTTKEAAAHCGVSVATFEARLVNSGPKFRAVRIGRRRLFDIRAIDAWIDSESGMAERSAQSTKPQFDWEGSFNDEDQRAGN